MPFVDFHHKLAIFLRLEKYLALFGFCAIDILVLMRFEATLATTEKHKTLHRYIMKTPIPQKMIDPF